MNHHELHARAKSYLNRGLNGVVLLRHAHRQEIPEQAFGNEIPITEEGHRAALKWGNAFHALPFEKIESSPVLRCLQTAQCIQTAFKRKIDLNLSTLLGNPGIFIEDLNEAHHLFLSHTLFDILRNLVQGHPLKGMNKIANGVNLFLNEFLFKNSKLTLLITHDSIMIPICCYLFNSIDIEKYTPSFLEFALIFYDEEQLYCSFRDEEKIISRHKSFDSSSLKNN